MEGPMSGGRSKARLRVWGERINLGSRRIPRLRWLWLYEVTDSEGKVVRIDNTCDGPGIIRAGLRALASVRDMESSGHRIQYSFSELVDQASGRQ